MTDILASSARRYLTPSNPTFWKWAVDGTAVEWPDGQTIAFRDELLGIMEPLAKSGLAPFDLIVLILAACRDSWKVDESRHEAFRSAFALRARANALASFEQALRELDRIVSLASPLRIALLARTELVSMILERHSARTSPELGEEILQELRDGFPNDPEVTFDEVIKPVTKWIAELRGLCDGLRKVDAEALQLRLQTGLSQLPSPVSEEPDVPPPSHQLSGPEFLAELEWDEQYRGLARLARNLMAVTSLPRPLGELETLPIGGVSDISNQGALDQLLLSELANDDDVLMTRVALREAMYLRRETPPSHPPQQQTLLVDSGLRMWGLPRLFATGVALSMAAGSRLPTRVFRPQQKEVVPIDLLSKEGLIQHLGELDPGLHPGPALAEFKKQLGLEDQQVVLITGEDVLSDSSFRRSLDEIKLPPFYVVTVNREGRFRLSLKSLRGERLLREAVFDLQCLFGSESPRLKDELIDEQASPDLPAILRLRRFPLLLSHSIKPDRTFCLNNPDGQMVEVMSIPGDGRLMLWTRLEFGALQISDGVPRGEVLSIHEDNEIVRIAVGQLQAGRVSLVWFDRSSHECRIIPVKTDKYPVKAVTFHNGNLLLVIGDSVRVYHGTDGQFRHSITIKGRRWVSGRFFLGPDALFAACAGGTSVVLESVLPVSDMPTGKKILTVFDSTFARTPIIVYGDGSIQIPPNPVRLINHGMNRPLRVAAVSRNGSRLVLQQQERAAGEQYGLVRLDLPSLPCFQFTGLPRREIDDSDTGVVHPRMLRHKFSGVGISGSELIFVTTRGTGLVLTMNPSRGDSSQDQFILSQVTSMATVKLWAAIRQFEPLSRRKSSSLPLKIVKWDDGSRIWLDPRGMVHLRSSDPSIPEATIVMHDAGAAGWISTGQYWGNPYFLGVEKVLSRISVSSFLSSVLKPFVDRLR